MKSLKIYKRLENVRKLTFYWLEFGTERTNK